MPERACGAVVETVSVAVPEPLATELGLNEQVGRAVTEGVIALQDRLTVPLKAFTGAIVIVEAADPPAAIETGQSVEAVIVKSATGAAVTVRLTVALWFKDPEPAMVTVKVPVGVVAEVLTVNAEVPEPLAIELGTNTHVGAGLTTGLTLLQDRLPVPLKPLSGATVIVEVADAPAGTVAGESGDAAIVKSGGGGIGLTVRLTDV